MVMPKQMTRALPVGVVMLALMSQPALAAVSCNFSITRIIFGSINLSGGQGFQSSETLSATCTGGAANGALTICAQLREGSGGLNSGRTSRTMKNDTAAMEYNLSIAGKEWGAIGGPFTPFLWQVTLNPSGNFNSTQSVNGSVRSFQTTLPAGLYEDSLAAKIQYKDGLHDCDSARGSNQWSLHFEITATNIAACTVSATNLNFESTSLLTSNIDATSSVAVTCTNGLPYKVGLDGGLSGAADPTNRKMTLSSEQVRYGLYLDRARTTLPWGDTIDTNTVGEIGSGSLKAITVYGRVPPQTAPAPGTYTDTIVVTVTF